MYIASCDYRRTHYKHYYGYINFCPNHPIPFNISVICSQVLSHVLSHVIVITYPHF